MRVAGAVLVVVVVSLVVAGLAGQRPESPATSTVAGASPGSVRGTTLWVRVPTGKVEVVVGDPVATIPAGRTESGESIAAAPGMRFLPVGVSVGAGLGLRGLGVDFSEAPRAALTLRLAGEGFDLPAVVPTDGLYLRIPSAAIEPEQLQLVAEYDGVTQTVDGTGERERGAAAALYGLPGDVPAQPCHRGWRARPRATVVVSCSAYVQSLPYLPELGWAGRAEPGALWSVAAVTSVLESASLPARGGSSGACTLVLPGSGRLQLDGEAPRSVLTSVARSIPLGQEVRTTGAFLTVGVDRARLRIVRDVPCLARGSRFDLRLVRARAVDLGAGAGRAR